MGRLPDDDDDEADELDDDDEADELDDELGAPLLLVELETAPLAVDVDEPGRFASSIWTAGLLVGPSPTHAASVTVAKKSAYLMTRAS